LDFLISTPKGIKMDVQHSRYKEFSVKASHDNDTYQELSTLKMILFKDDYKLRSHAIKHFMHTDEFETVWKKIQSNINSIAGYITNLENIECPIILHKDENLLCRNCRIFKECTVYAIDIEKAYLKAIEKVISMQCNLPRYAVFFSNKEKQKVFSGLSDNRIILKASEFKEDIFNISTCYVSDGKKRLVESINNQATGILEESDNLLIEWYNKSNWGIETSLKDFNNGEKKSKKKNIPKSPYRRKGGGSNWKQFLDGSD